MSKVDKNEIIYFCPVCGKGDFIEPVMVNGMVKQFKT
jgi:hypothetical protein